MQAIVHNSVPIIDVDPTSNGGYINPIAKTKLPNGTFSIPTSLTMDKDPNHIPSLTQEETKTKKAKLSSERNMSPYGIPTGARTFGALHSAINKTKRPTNGRYYIPTSSIMDEDAHKQIPSPVHEEAKKKMAKFATKRFIAQRGIS